MAKKKKQSKSKPKTKETETDASQRPKIERNSFLEDNLDEIAELEQQGITLKTPKRENGKLLDELASLVSSKELEVLKTCGAFGEAELDVSDAGRQYIDSKEYQKHALGMPARHSRAPPPPVPIFADFPGKSSSQALAGELRYLQTVLHPAEMRWLVAELACDSLEQTPVTHTDISDAVIASIAPSTAQKVAFQADAQYKYTTAQFLQVYMKMRHVVLEHKIMLAGARADALLLAMSPYDFQPLQDSDIVPVSAVEALRHIIDAENMLR